MSPDIHEVFLGTEGLVGDFGRGSSFAGDVETFSALARRRRGDLRKMLMPPLGVVSSFGLSEVFGVLPIDVRGVDVDALSALEGLCLGGVEEVEAVLT